MIKIYWDKDKISMLTDQIDAVEHKHWALQLFLSLKENLDICISGKRIRCKGVVVNGNVSHSFSSDSRLHFSIIIGPASDTASQLKKIIKSEDYYIFDNPDIVEAQNLAYELVHNNELDAYHSLISRLYDCLGINEQVKIYDDRIKELLRYIECCNCDVQSISTFADKVALSPSRLSHLFREQTGMPLKSYIQFHQMQKAFLALLNGENITKAAMLANFDTPSHFAAVTKRMMGMPASLFLKDSVFLKVYDV